MLLTRHARAAVCCGARTPGLTRLIRTPTCTPLLRQVAALRPMHDFQFRSCTTESKPGEAEDSKPVHVYEGAKNKIVKTIKTVSIANLGFALISAPIMQYVTAQMGAPGKGVAMSALLLFFGGGTTGALTWATTTYVMSIRTLPGKDALLITTPTFTGSVTETEVQWADIRRPSSYHPFVTFEAAGKKFYLDELGEMKDDSFPEKLEAALNK